MYVPAPFHEERPDEIRRIIEAFPLAMLVATGSEGLTANHLPLLPTFDATGALVELTGHIARASHLVADLAAGGQVLVVYRADDSYVSPNWYPSKPETHRAVPTWNYQAVHCLGHALLVDDERFVRGVVARLTKVHEDRVGEAEPWRMGQAPTEYLDEMLAAIVGVRIEVERVIAKSKLSQNREARDAEGVAMHLDALGAADLATGVRRGSALGES